MLSCVNMHQTVPTYIYIAMPLSKVSCGSVDAKKSCLRDTAGIDDDDVWNFIEDQGKFLYRVSYEPNRAVMVEFLLLGCASTLLSDVVEVKLVLVLLRCH